MNKKPAKVTDHNLWDNHMTRSAIKAMTPEQLQEYQRIGEEMYGTIDFEDNKYLKSLPPPLAESAAYISEGLKSGLHPMDLKEKEVLVLEEVYGKDNWYKQFGYTKEDIPEFKTSVKLDLCQPPKK